MIKNTTPYIGKIRLKFEKYPEYTGKSKLNKIHLLYTMFLSTIGLFEKAYWNQDQLKIAKKRIKSSS